MDGIEKEMAHRRETYVVVVIMKKVAVARKDRTVAIARSFEVGYAVPAVLVEVQVTWLRSRRSKSYERGGRRKDKDDRDSSRKDRRRNRGKDRKDAEEREDDVESLNRRVVGLWIRRRLVGWATTRTSQSLYEECAERIWSFGTTP